MRWIRALALCVALSWSGLAFADGFTWDSGYKGDVPNAVNITNDTSSFNNNLSSTDTTVQTALDTLDNATLTGDAVTVNSTASTNANFLDNIYIDWTLDTAATPDDVTAKLDYTQTLAGNPAFAAGEVALTTSGTTGGVLFEGAADAIEGLLQWAPTTSDRTLTLPDVSSTLTVQSDNLSVFAATSSAQLAGVISDEQGSGGGVVFATSPTLTTPTLGVATATTLDTGQGANELYDMDQDVLTTSSPTFLDLTLSGSNPDLRWAHTGSNTFHMGAESGSLLFLSNVTSGAKYLQILAGSSMTYGDASITTHIFSTAATGDTAFEAPPSSIALRELADEAKTHTRCAYIENLAAADDNKSMGSLQRPVTVLALWCNHNGTPTTVGQFTLEDGAGNAMTHTTAVCTPEATPANPIAVTAGGALTAQEVLRFDVSNAVSPETDDYTLCVRYRYD